MICRDSKSKSPTHQITKSRTLQCRLAFFFRRPGQRRSALRGVARARTTPLYVSVGLAWEPAERALVRHHLSKPFGRDSTSRCSSNCRSDMRDIYAPTHWAIVGRAAGVSHPGRRRVSAAAGISFFSAEGAGVLAPRLASTGSCWGRSITIRSRTRPEFRRAMNLALTEGLNHNLSSTRRYAKVSKAEVGMPRHGDGLLIELTLSCMNPVVSEHAARHCGRCRRAPRTA